MKTIINRQLSIVNFMKIAVLFFFITLFSHQAYAQSPDRTKPPALGPTPSVKINAVQKFELKNGLQVIVYEKHEVPIVQMNLVIKAGSVNESNDKLGLAGLTANMLDEGAAGKSSLELSDAIDFLGTSINSNGGLHTTGVSMRSTVSKFDESLKLFADIVLHPDFPSEELARLQKQYLTSLMQAYDQPRAIAAAASSQFVFGKEHPYGRTTVGTEQSLKNFTVDDLKNFYAAYYHPNNSFLVVVGDIKANDVVAKLESALGSWEKKEVPAAVVSQAKQVKERKIYLVDKPEAAQSVIRVCRVGVNRMTEDYFPLLVMNTILGGSFTSRLNNNLREKNGYTYGAGSGFGFRPSAGPFTASSDVQTDVTDKALKEFMKELEGISKPVSDEELNRAKNYIALGYPDNFSNVSSIAGQLVEMVLYNLPADYFNTYIGKVMAVKKEDVRRVAKKYIDTDDLAIIIVGDKAKVEKGVQATKVGKIINMVPTDVLGPMPKL
ncbi:MAG: pitrilysin family protein [Bacteroidota bacterium]|nr:pitrilysin family protein [Bacteroidota bacterium]